MLILKKTISEDQDFIHIVKLLDADLAKRDGEDHNFYAQYNSLNSIKHTLVMYLNDKPIGCGAIKQFETDSMEIKRMFVLPEYRQLGLATKILKELEQWTKQLGFKKCVLETGKRQPEAIKLYRKNNYIRIPNYGQYKNVDNSLCFIKYL